MSSRSVTKWVQRRETLAAATALLQARDLIVKNPETAYAEITKRLTDIEGTLKRSER